MSNLINGTIGCNVRFLRQERGLSTEDLARLAYMSVGAVNNIENGKYKRTINLNNVLTLAKALHVEADVLTEENDAIKNLFLQAKNAIRKKQYNELTIQLVDELLDITVGRGPRDRAKALLMRGEIDYNCALYSLALQRFEDALEIAERGIDQELIHDVRYNLASTLLVLGELDSALNHVTFDMMDCQSPLRRAKNHLLLGFIHGKQDRLKESEYSFLQALEESKQQPQSDTGLEGRCHQALGEVYRLASEIEKSIFHSEVAFTLATMTDDYIVKVYAKKTIADAYLDIGDVEAAKSALLEALEESKKISEFRKLELNKMLFALAYCDQDYQGIKDILAKIENLHVAPKDMAVMYKNVAQLAMTLGVHEEGTEFFLKGLKIMGI